MEQNEERQISPGGGMPWGYRKLNQKVQIKMTNENILEDLQKFTSALLNQVKAGLELDRDMVEKVCNDFIQLDISLSYNNGELPGAWGASKISKSNQS